MATVDSQDLLNQPSTVDNFSEQYGMNIMPPTDSFTISNQPFEQTYLSSMADLDALKYEPDLDWEVESSSTLKSGSTPLLESFAGDPSVQGNKRRRGTSNSTLTLDPLAATSSDLSREKNRVAASKCRRKKKAEEKQLEERRRMLQVQNSILADSAAALRSEVLDLKNEVLKHGTCDFGPIQHYINTAANQVG